MGRGPEEIWKDLLTQKIEGSRDKHKKGEIGGRTFTAAEEVWGAFFIHKISNGKFSDKILKNL